MSRVEIISKRIAAISPRFKVVAHVDPLETDADVIEAIEGSDFVVGCVDAGLTSLFYKLNRACLQLRIPWTSCAVYCFGKHCGADDISLRNRVLFMLQDAYGCLCRDPRTNFLSNASSTAGSRMTVESERISFLPWVASVTWSGWRC